jgi:hypothetical protein
MSGAGGADAGLWGEFFDEVGGALRLDELEAEFNRFWSDITLT